MRSPRPRFTVLGLILLIAFIGCFFTLISLFSSNSPTATVEFVNKTSHPVGRVEIDYPGGLVRLDSLQPGEVTRRRVQASQVFHPSSFNIKFGIRATGIGGVRHGSHTIGFDPYNFQPHVRWELIEDGPNGTEIRPVGMMAYPTSRLKRAVIDAAYRLR